MQLIISVCENYLSQPKWTTLVFVLKLDSSEYHIKMSFFNILTMSRHILYLMEASWDVVFLIVMSKFPNYWVFFKNRFACWILKKGQIGREVGFFHLKYVTIIMVVCVFKTGCECRFHSWCSAYCIKCSYKQDVCCTHFCLIPIDKMLLSSTMKWMWVIMKLFWKSEI